MIKYLKKKLYESDLLNFQFSKMTTIIYFITKNSERNYFFGN